MKVKVLKTNRRVKESPYLTACKERDGVLGNIELNEYTNVDAIVSDKAYYVSPGENVKRRFSNTTLSQEISPGTFNINVSTGEAWYTIADELNKPGVFDKLADFFKFKK